MPASVSDVDVRTVLEQLMKNMAEMNDTINKLRHKEYGVVDCTSDGNSDSWPGRDGVYEWVNKFIPFDTPYDTPPVVHLGGLKEFSLRSGGPQSQVYRVLFSLRLKEVTTIGFTVQCIGWEDGPGNYDNLPAWDSFFDRINWMKADWASFSDIP